jgi:hypothetical protein
MTEEELLEYKKANPKSKKTTIECWPGKAAITYINQKNMERRLDRSLDGELEARATSWGKFVEKLLFSMLEEEYTYNSSETLVHPEYDCWVATPDGFNKKAKERTLAETKCPFTMESFCKLVASLYNGFEGMEAMNALRNGYTDKTGLFQPPHPDAEKYYWQMVSSSCVEPCEAADFIIYCPYESELQAIQAAAVQSGDPSVYFIANASKNALPYIKDDGFYQNINIFSFKIPDEDKKLLTETVKKAEKYLISV